MTEILTAAHGYAPDFFAPRFEIKISGLTMAADLTNQVLSLVVETDIDIAGSFTITLRNPDNRLLDSPLLDLGKTVEIHLGYGNALEPAFLGEITGIEPSFPAGGPATVRVTGYDKSYKLRRAQPEPTEYQYLNDSVIAARIAVEHGLIPMVDPVPGPPKKKIIQVESDMAFLKSRAERYFFDVYVEWDRLHFQFPRPRTAAYVLEWGKNLSSFSPRISSAGLAGLQMIRGYNQELAQTVLGIALAADVAPDNLLERLGSSAVDLLTSLVHKGIRDNTVENPFDAMLAAKSMLTAMLEGLYEGNGECIGLPGLRAGDYVAIAGVGKRFSGTYRVRNVTHSIDDGGFRTRFSITQRGHTSMLGMLRKFLVEEASPNKARKFYGVVIGEVESNHEVADGEIPTGRVRVTFPGPLGGVTSTWAPCARPMAGDGMGFYALPERGDQVVVAFENGDIAKPYVVGSLGTALAPPPARNVDGTNSIRMIKSRAGHSITFDDTLDTGKLVIEDKQGSSITLDALDGSITISARGNLTIAANGTLTLSATTVNVT